MISNNEQKEIIPTFLGVKAKSIQTTCCKMSEIKRINALESLQLIKLKLFYQRDKYLVALQMIFIEKEKMNSDKIDNSNYMFSNPKILGISNFLLGEVDDIELNFAKDEEISLIKIFSVNDAITKMQIETNFGQFIQFGDIEDWDDVVEWEFFSNDNLFDGFTIGWDQNKINYIEKEDYREQKDDEEEPNKEEKIVLRDVTNDINVINANPLYISEIYGKDTKEIDYDDDLEKFGIFKEIKTGEVYLNEISIYYDGKNINRIDTEYTNNVTGLKRRNKHTSTSYNENNRKMCLLITKNDFVKEFNVIVSSKGSIKGLRFETNEKKELIWPNGNDERNESNKEEKTKRLLGLIVGRKKHIQSIQFYYEKINK